MRGNDVLRVILSNLKIKGKKPKVQTAINQLLTFLPFLFLPLQLIFLGATDEFKP